MAIGNIEESGDLGVGVSHHRGHFVAHVEEHPAEGSQVGGLNAEGVGFMSEFPHEYPTGHDFSSDALVREFVNVNTTLEKRHATGKATRQLSGTDRDLPRMRSTEIP
jgi:hypothetical protein